MAMTITRLRSRRTPANPSRPSSSLDKIADAEEGLTVGQAELSQWLVTQAPRYGMTPDQFAEALVQAGQVQMAVADVRRGKALALVLQKADVTDASGNEVNLSALDEAVEENSSTSLRKSSKRRSSKRRWKGRRDRGCCRSHRRGRRSRAEAQEEADAEVDADKK